MPQPPTTPFSGIFISYRRDDSSGHAGRLFDNLAKHFGQNQIFMDIDTIEPGEDFVTVIENAVGSCEILIVIIGRQWLSNAGDATRRLDNPNDFVRLEITTALNRGIRVIPVLVQRASMPRPQDLPEDLAKLTRRNAVELSDLRWQTDVDRLIGVMERILAKRQEAVRPAESAQRVEEERQLREAEEKMRSELEAQGKLAADEERREGDEAKRNEGNERQEPQFEASTQAQPVGSRPRLGGFSGVKKPIWIGAVALLLVVVAMAAVWLALGNRTANERSGIEPTPNPTPVLSPTQSASPTAPSTRLVNGADNANKNVNKTKVTGPADSGRSEKQKRMREAALRQKCAAWVLDHGEPCPYK